MHSSEWGEQDALDVACKRLVAQSASGFESVIAVSLL